MRYSQLFSKTSKSVPHDADSANARLLAQGGFVHQEVAGVYTFLPKGLRVLRKIEAIIREEMEKVGGAEILMPALTPKGVWEKTNRWEGFDALFRLEGVGGKEYALGATHEEIVTPLAQEYTFSYKDLPFSVFQIQNKFRNEARAKSGLLRGREFSMKDLYSFHKHQEDLDEYYETVKELYLKIFNRLGFGAEITYTTYASGGAFSKFSHEFQVIHEVGEDTIYACDNCHIAVNKEIIEDQSTCPSCGNDDLEEKKGIEVGNIFKLGTRFSDAFGFKYTDDKGQQKPVYMGCYGIGPSRIMGSIVEVYNDENGIIWPRNIAPYQVHIVSLGKDEAVIQEADKLYQELVAAGIEVLYDDRDAGAGAKLADADLIGIPVRLVVSSRTLEAGSAEWKERDKAEAENVKLTEVEKKTMVYYS
ncbi:MAG: His/Gly/Thr/Pro-type tRNA ligase C-terminal domain-containing protein [Candidatus Peregrinibacteria bacterium]|nr:His/Gly/Thr/Pro-type tRNA ligase C-terminal domain-containing protein [Candidatus Peregrinibacteria bacterium]